MFEKDRRFFLAPRHLLANNFGGKRMAIAASNLPA